MCVTDVWMYVYMNVSSWNLRIYGWGGGGDGLLLKLFIG